MTLIDLLQDVAKNAPVERAGQWLMLAADDYPELFAAITTNLDADPAQVIQDLARRYPEAALLAFFPSARNWIANLQQFFKSQYARRAPGGTHGKTR